MITIFLYFMHILNRHSVRHIQAMKYVRDTRLKRLYRNDIDLHKMHIKNAQLESDPQY